MAGGGGGASNDINACRNGANRNGVNASITTSGTASGDGVVAGGTAGNGGGANNGSGGGGGGFFTDGTAGSGLPGNNGKSYINGGAGGNSGIISGTAFDSGNGTLTYTFAHGITEAIARVIVQAANQETIGDFYPEITATDIIIHYNIPPVSGSSNLKWSWVAFLGEATPEPASGVFEAGVFVGGVFE